MQSASGKCETKPHMEDATFARYYYEIGCSCTQMLDAATERELFLKYRRKRRGKIIWTSAEARDRIIKNCLRFVVKLAYKYTSDLVTLKELIAAGNEGLCVALGKYNPKHSSGTRFLSYAVNYILLYMRNELHNSNLINMPLWRQKALRKVRRARSKLEALGEDAQSGDRVCEEANVTCAQLEKLQIEKIHFIPFDNVNISTNGNEAHTINTQAKELLHDLILSLPPKERFVINAYFGCMAEPMSLQKIARVLRVSSERVRQIKVEALNNLRNKFQQCCVNDTGDLIVETTPRGSAHLGPGRRHGRLK